MSSAPPALGRFMDAGHGDWQEPVRWIGHERVLEGVSRLPGGGRSERDHNASAVETLLVVVELIESEGRVDDNAACVQLLDLVRVTLKCAGGGVVTVGVAALPDGVAPAGDLDRASRVGEPVVDSGGRLALCLSLVTPPTN